jgi:hypothetical protein
MPLLLVVLTLNTASNAVSSADLKHSIPAVLTLKNKNETNHNDQNFIQQLSSLLHVSEAHTPKKCHPPDAQASH